MRIETQVLGHQAYETVKDMILSGKLIPGQKIVQDQLAQALGISRTPLRSALQILEGENLVESIPRRGVQVKKFSLQEISNIYDCRIALEAMAVKLFTKENDINKIQYLKNLFSSFKSGLIDHKLYKEVDSGFHTFIVNHCGNLFLKKTVHNSNMLSCIDIIGLVRTPEETLTEHLEILDAIESKDILSVEKLMILHLEKSKELIQKKIDNEKQILFP